MAVAALGAVTLASSVATADNLVFSHTQISGSDVILVVNINTRNNTIATVTYDGVFMTEAVSTLAQGRQSASYYMQNPPQGVAADVVITMNDFVSYIDACALGFSGGLQAGTPVGNATNATNTGIPAATLGVVQAGSALIDSSGHSSTNVMTPTAPQVETQDVQTQADSDRTFSSYQLCPTAGAYTQSWYDIALATWHIALWEMLATPPVAHGGPSQSMYIVSMRSY